MGTDLATALLRPEGIETAMMTDIGRDRARARRATEEADRGVGRFRSPSPKRDVEDDLPLPRRAARDVPDCQILVLDTLDRDFISWVEQAFSARSVRVDVLLLSPRLSEQAVVRRQILEGVVAVSKLTRQNQDRGKIGLQIFDRRGRGGECAIRGVRQPGPGHLRGASIESEVNACSSDSCNELWGRVRRRPALRRSRTSFHATTAVRQLPASSSELRPTTSYAQLSARLRRPTTTAPHHSTKPLLASRPTSRISSRTWMQETCKTCSRP